MFTASAERCTFSETASGLHTRHRTVSDDLQHINQLTGLSTELLCVLLSADGNAVPTGSGSFGGGIRHFSLHPRCLHHSEVSELTAALKHERKIEVENLVSVYLQGMGMEPGIAAWAAREAEGATIEEKINSVLNLMPGALGGDGQGEGGFGQGGAMGSRFGGGGMGEYDEF